MGAVVCVGYPILLDIYNVRRIVNLYILPQVPTVSEVFQEAEEVNATMTNLLRILTIVSIGRAMMTAAPKHKVSLKIYQRKFSRYFYKVVFTKLVPSI